MNKKYVAPQIGITDIVSEGIVAGSDDKLEFSSDAATHSIDPNDDVLSNRKRSIWDEE